MKKLFILLIVHCSLLIVHCFAQSITWQRLYDPTPQRDLGTDICNAGNGNFYITGYKNYFPDQIIVLKINPYGDIIWTKIISGNYQERGIAIASSIDGGCVITGWSDSSYSLKLDSNGNIIWKKYYGIGRCYDIRQTSDGGFIACGEVYELVTRGYVYKIDANGNLQWQIEYPTAYNNGLYSIIEAKDSGYISVGGIMETYNDTVAILVLKLNDSGSLSWFKKYRIQNTHCSGLNVSKINNQYLITGSLLLNQQSSLSRVFMSRINNNGDTIFNKIFSSDRQEISLGLEKINNNKYVICMTRDSVIYPSTNSKAIIVDSTGNLLKEKVFFGVSYLTANSVLSINNGDFIFAGSYKIGSAYYFYGLRTDSNLIYPPIGIKNIYTNVPTEFKIYQNYPNPFNPITKITFEIPLNSHVIITVYNLLGQEMKKLVDGNMNRGIYTTSFDGTSLSSGVYFCTLFADGFKFTRKLILIK